MTFREKSKEVEAFQMGINGEPTPAPAWFGSPKGPDISTQGVWIRDGYGCMTLARWGWWVVKHEDGGMSTMDDATFKKRYEEKIEFATCADLSDQDTVDEEVLIDWEVPHWVHRAAGGLCFVLMFLFAIIDFRRGHMWILTGIVEVLIGLISLRIALQRNVKTASAE